MPGMDRTGPRGMGPMTGRRMGWCGQTRPGVFSNVPPMGFGGGRGRNWGMAGLGGGFWRRRCMMGGAVQQPWVYADSLSDLKRYADNMEEALRSVRAQIEELQSREAEGRD